MIYPSKADLRSFNVDEFAEILMKVVDDMKKEEQEAIMQAL